jgi:hypothetical protein
MIASNGPAVVELQRAKAAAVGNAGFERQRASARQGYEVHAAKPKGKGALNVRDGEPGPHQR